MSKKTIKASTIKRKVKTIKSLLKHGVDLGNPEAVIRFLNECNWASGTKDIVIDSYRDYLDMLGLTEVKLPHIRREEKLPFIPLEQELDALISSVNAKMGVFLRLLKETAIRPIEAWSLKWFDIDIDNKCITITPAKYSHARKLRISEQTLNMLLALPRTNQYVFSPSGNPDRFFDELEHFARNYQKQKKRIALKLQNPRLNLISFRTFRHWKATMEYMKTRDIVYVKEFLGHVNIKNTLRYIHLANAIAETKEEYICKTARNIEEAQKLIEQGFEYITTFECIMLFRKRK